MIYGYGTKLKLDKFVGYRICGTCQKVNSFYLARTVFTFHICFIPIIRYTKKRYLICTVCKNGYELSKDDYKIAYNKFKNFFSQEECQEHYNYIKQLCQGLDFSEYNQTTVYQNLCQKYPAVQEFEDYYMMIIKDVLKYVDNSVVDNNQ
jgi:hypothetical protein